MNKKLLFIIMSFSLSISCSHLKGRQSKIKELKNHNTKFSYVDTTGSYQLWREVGSSAKKKQTFVKEQLFEENNEGKDPLERSVSISQWGKLKLARETVDILNPRLSQYSIWLEGAKYFSQISVDKKSRKIEVLLESPEKKWNGHFNFSLPQEKSIYCFYSQIVECVKVTKFLEKAAKLRTGKMNLYIIWDSYPYHQEQFKNISDNIFSKATFSFDGKSKEKEIKFIMEVEGQAISFHFDENLNFIKKFWVGQGISQVQL